MSSNTDTSNTGFNEAERKAMQERAEELRAQRGGKKKADNLQALFEKIDEMPEGDRELAVALHQIVTEVAPELSPRTWYGMPAYEKDGSVLLFLQVTSKFDARYTTLGFNDAAALDDGEIWPTHFAIPRLTDKVRDKMRELVVKAVG